MDEQKTQEVEKSLINSFELVKKAVRKIKGMSRAGLMLGLQELGSTVNGFIGAYYQIASNIIVVNSSPIRRINETKPDLLKPYGFHVLMHEYIHSLGYLDESMTEQLTYYITKEYLGEDNIATKLSADIKQFFPNLVYPVQGWTPQKGFPKIKVVKGFDWSNYDFYIT
jgi:hypothetical protein